MTDPQTDDREEMKGMMIDSNIDYAVLAMLFEPVIKTYSKALKPNESCQASLFLRPERRVRSKSGIQSYSQKERLRPSSQMLVAK